MTRFEVLKPGKNHLALFGNLLKCQCRYNMHTIVVSSIKRRVVPASIRKVHRTIRWQMGSMMIDDKHRARV